MPLPKRDDKPLQPLYGSYILIRLLSVAPRRPFHLCYSDERKFLIVDLYMTKRRRVGEWGALYLHEVDDKLVVHRVHPWAVLSRDQQGLWSGTGLIVQEQHPLIIFDRQILCALLPFLLLIGQSLQQAELRKKDRNLDPRVQPQSWGQQRV